MEKIGDCAEGITQHYLNEFIRRLMSWLHYPFDAPILGSPFPFSPSLPFSLFAKAEPSVNISIAIIQ